MQPEVVNNIFRRKEYGNTNVDQSDSASQPAVANGHQTVNDADEEKAIIKQKPLKGEIEMLQKR